MKRLFLIMIVCFFSIQLSSCTNEDDELDQTVRANEIIQDTEQAVDPKDVKIPTNG